MIVSVEASFYFNINKEVCIYKSFQSLKPVKTFQINLCKNRITIQQ